MMEQYSPSPFLIFVGAIVLFSIVAIYMGIKMVPQSEEWTVERFGRYIRTIKPGLSLLIPFVDAVGFKIAMRETVLEIPSQDVISFDNATVTADGIAFYQVIDAAKAAYEIRDLERAIMNLAMTNIRTVIGSMALDDILSKRDDINERLLRVIDAATTPWGVKVTRVEIKDLNPQTDLVEAMGQQMKAERLKRAEILQAEGEKQAAILRAEGMKQAAILDAEGAREAAFREAEGREREAEAEAKATISVSQAIADGDLNAINFFVAQQYIKALEGIASAPNEKVILFPIEASNVIGSLGGIAELAKQVFNPGKTPSNG